VDLILKLGLVTVVVAGLWWAFQYTQTKFIVRIRAGVPQVVKGSVPAGFLGELAEVCREHHIESGTIRGMQRGRRVALSFSGPISPGCRQRVRNIWAFQAR
jgi:hypothetical protein